MLCELCTVVQALMALDGANESLDDDDDDENDRHTPINDTSPYPPLTAASQQNGFASAQNGSTSMKTMQPLRSLKFSMLLQGVLQDIQTRLVFRAQAVIHLEVLHYAPKPEDLEFPEKLRSAKRMSVFLSSEDNDDGESSSDALLFRLPGLDVQDTWYPTLRKTLWVLSKLHTYIQVRVSHPHSL